MPIGLVDAAGSSTMRFATLAIVSLLMATPAAAQDNTVQFAQAAPSADTTVDEKDAIHTVISGYYDAFGRGTVAESAFYGEPTFFVLPNQVGVLSTRADVQAFWDRAMANLKANGYSHSKFGDYRVKLLNSKTALVSLVATRIKTDGSEMQRFGVLYLLRKGDAGWKIHEFVVTDLDKLISAD
jgi:ketosteroid isomerase-like protein